LARQQGYRLAGIAEQDRGAFVPSGHDGLGDYVVVRVVGTQRKHPVDRIG
jgi:hypothetical protein